MTALVKAHTSYDDFGERMIAWSFNHLDLAYGLGGDGVTNNSGRDNAGHVIGGISMDCSGLVKSAAAYASSGSVDLAHYATYQYYESARIWSGGIGWLRRGDLVFYEPNDQKTGPAGQRGGFDHVNIFLGWYKGHPWCVQATTFGIRSEVIPMVAYAHPVAYGRIRYGDWHVRSRRHAVYAGARISVSKWRAWL